MANRNDDDSTESTSTSTSNNNKENTSVIDYTNLHDEQQFMNRIRNARTSYHSYKQFTQHYLTQLASKEDYQRHNYYMVHHVVYRSFMYDTTFQSTHTFFKQSDVIPQHINHRIDNTVSSVDSTDTDSHDAQIGHATSRKRRVLPVSPAC